MKLPTFYTVHCPRCGVEIMVGVTDISTRVLPDRLVVEVGVHDPRHRCADLPTMGGEPT
jgi:hypothetical protein